MSQITPFSTLVLCPFATLPGLTAKHLWLLINGLILIASYLLLRRLTALPHSRLTLLVAASYPLHRNMLYGQLYLLLLFLLLLACWLYTRERKFSAGVLIAIAAGIKVFPAIYLFYFIKKRDLRAIAGVLTGGFAVIALSLATFGVELNRIYLTEVLPWGMRGEVSNPYALGTASLATLLHALFAFEPTLNPHPAIDAPILLALSLPLLQLTILAPAFLFTSKNDNPRHLRWEWSIFLLATLAIAPVPASYHFVLLLLPVACLLAEECATCITPRQLILFALFLAIGFPWAYKEVAPGWKSLLLVPRLFALLAFYVFALRQRLPHLPRTIHNRTAAPIAFAAIWIISAFFGLRHLSSQHKEMLHAVALHPAPLLVAAPQATQSGIVYVRMTGSGYSLSARASPQADQLSHTTTAAGQWIEESSVQSRILQPPPFGIPIPDAESPIISPDGHWLAFIRQKRARGALWVRSLDDPGLTSVITPSDLDVYEAAFSPDNSLILSASLGDSAPQLFEMTATGSHITPLQLLAARYPAISPDGRWLAFSQRVRGTWRLRLLCLGTHQTIHLTDADCNTTQAAWEADSNAVLYVSDCGRALGLTTLHRQQIPH